MKIAKVDARYLDYAIIKDEMFAWFDKFANKQGWINYGGCYNLPLNFRMRPAGKRYGRTRPSSSGRAWSYIEITVNAGSDPEDFKHVLLHELVHTATLCHTHDATFYIRFFEAAKAYGEDMQKWYNRERWYKPRSLNQAMKAKRQYQLIKPRRNIEWDMVTNSILRRS